jgi:hypothetical protein
MKHSLFSLLLMFTVSMAIAQNKEGRGLTTIDAGDTVFFDIAHSTYPSGYVDFPVFFHSDDTINAIDFSCMFNTACFTYDSVIRLANYLSVTANYDSSSATFFLTAFSLQRITNDTPLVKIRLHNLLSGTLCSGNLFSVVAYLNGDVCSEVVTNPVGCIPSCPLGIQEIQSKISSFEFYPNPVTSSAEIKFYSETNEDAFCSISDLTGRIFMKENLRMTEGSNQLPLELNGLAQGVYILTLKAEHTSETIRIIKL